MIFKRLQSTQAYTQFLTLLKNDLKQSMKAKDHLKKDTIKGLLSQIKNMEIDTKNQDEYMLSDLFNKAIKQRKDAIEQFTERPDLKEKEEQEMVVIHQYLKSLPVTSKEELESKVVKLLEDNQGKSIKEIFSAIKWDQLTKEWNCNDKMIRAAIGRLYKR
jgi:uncharacterized protein YqeY